jgi:NAD(P)-dependent dehydrogenase (short-subunit alcohol dehydrogenase family)
MGLDVLVVIGVGGMGEAIARRLGSGRKLLIADFNAETLATVRARLELEGHDVTARPIDVADPDDVASLADDAAALGPVRWVAHTAGIGGIPVERTLAVDLFGVAYVIEEFERVIEPGGAAVVIASMAGHTSPHIDPDDAKLLSVTPARELPSLDCVDAERIGAGAAYSYSKRANQLRVQAASVSWGRKGARINSISPGVILTPMGRGALEMAGPIVGEMVAKAPMQRAGTPEDIAAAVEFLLGPNASYVTGTDLLVDGGVIGSIAAGELLRPSENPRLAEMQGRMETQQA